MSESLFTARECYTLLYDEAQVKKFCSIMFGDMMEDDKLQYVRSFQLLARDKYSRDIKFGDRILLHQSVIRTIDPDKIVRQIKALEVPKGCYTYTKDDAQGDIPPDCLVLYVSLCPKSYLKAMIEMSHFVLNHVTNPKAFPNFTQPDFSSELMSQLHKTSVSGAAYGDLDIDSKDATFLAELVREVLVGGANLLASDAVKCIIETRNGYHIALNLARISKAQNGLLHTFTSKAKYVLTKTNRLGKPATDSMISLARDRDSLWPMPGTLQNGFKIRLVDVAEFVKV